MNYRLVYLDRIGCATDAQAWAQAFSTTSNHKHHHSGLGLLTAASVHYGQAEAILAKRQRTLQVAYVAHPERFVKGRPMPASLPEAAWINPPKPRVEGESGIRH